MTEPRDVSWAQRPERGSEWLLRLMFRIAMLMGRPVARALLWPIAAFFWLRTPAARADSNRYLRRLRGTEPGWSDSFRHYLTFSRTILDRFYLLGGREKLLDVHLHDQTTALADVARNQGAFLVGAHLGSFEVLRSVGRREPGLKVSMAMFEDNARKIGKMLRAIDPSLEMDVVALGRVDSMIEIQQRLDNGHVVGFLADRSFGRDPTVMVPFLGEAAPFPTGVFRMAAVLRRPVYLMAGLYAQGNRYDVFIEKLTDFSQVERGGRAAAVQTAVAHFAQRLEHYCRLAPYNWFNFYDFWAPHGAGSGQQVGGGGRSGPADGEAGHDGQ